MALWDKGYDVDPEVLDNFAFEVRTRFRRKPQPAGGSSVHG